MRSFKPSKLLVGLLLGLAGAAQAQQPSALEEQAYSRAAAVEPKLIKWRRDIHQHPELSEQETRTSKLVADHLRKLGMEVHTGIARTGVVGILTGGKPGPTVALRADMDALPVKEPGTLPFASKARGMYQGKEVDVMHACGHDAHTAMLMATAEVLAGMREKLPGKVMFIFQPAEEGSSLVMPGQNKLWGAQQMLKEGMFDKLKPDAVFAVHVMPGRSGELSWRTGATTASSDDLHITITGKQGHGGMPWNTIDPVVTAAQVLTGLQTVVSRRTNLTQSPAVVTVGMIQGGSAPNIVPAQVQMAGTIRTYDEKVRAQVGRDVKLSAEKIAESAGAKAEVSVVPAYGTTMNDEKLAAQMAPVLDRAASGKVATSPLVGASEDFSFFASQVPGLYFFLGVTPDGQDPATAAPNHNPNFFVDESALVVGTRALSGVTIQFLETGKKGG
ncbi:amidohydrolase [Candidatus Nitrotoga arctica]|uniref:Hydrolase YxeP n=1 Tax=Candidatus Nitrotoga arctica TaxID=453162 RepID=A0ABM8Z0A0_9PROT|nr:amidohydrolase [Candidatus Nitrotoga arctica]CAG9933292.1 putative hydrolase YxeP [Candidatus Nitrotoga arctica]